MKEHHLTAEEIEAGLAHLLQAPRAETVLDLIVRRPADGEREVLEVGQLDLDLGLVGDNWSVRGSSKTADGCAHPGMQLNLMGSRVIALLSGRMTGHERWPLAGDQLFMDLDTSPGNLPPGTRLAIGDAVIEITDVPHAGCDKFVVRFGVEAMRLVSSELGKAHNLRGVNARVVCSGVVRRGDRVVRVGRAADGARQAFGTD